jgi:hypothetical protein
VSGWQRLGGVAPTALAEARLQTHHAAQTVSAIGATYLEPAPDDSHPNLGWDEAQHALVGRSIPGSELRAALRVEDLTLLLLDGDAPLETLPLPGQSLTDAYAAFQEALEAHGAPPPNGKLTPPGYDIPGHAVADGAPFSLEEPAAFQELAHWFANGTRALTELATDRAEGAVVRCWPHHFDLGGLFVVSTGPDGQLTSSVGFGLSPGDESYAEPYAYVSPWPAPAREALPARDGLRWHTEGFTSAVLTGSQLLASGPDAEQRQRLRDFLDAAFVASREALG